MKFHPGRKVLFVSGMLWVFTTALMSQTANAKNLVVNGDFEKGNAGFTTQYSFGNVSNPGTYDIGTSPSSVPGAYGDWCNCGDHTTGAGMMLIANGATSASWPAWEQVVHVSPNKNYQFSYWGAEVDRNSNSLPRVVRILAVEPNHLLEENIGGVEHETRTDDSSRICGSSSAGQYIRRSLQRSAEGGSQVQRAAILPCRDALY